MPYWVPHRAARRRDGIAAVLTCLRVYDQALQWRRHHPQGLVRQGVHRVEQGCIVAQHQRDGHRRGQVVDMKAVETPLHLLMNHQPRIGSTSSPWSSLNVDEDDGSMSEFRPRKGHH
ncbi:hypothetical protein DFH08DRAFT_971281 [Mycena albidolilacea]|uniref:Uncharacterized protein n=1 Tax=Mycena albidolilacea TaxID=1033008 RepID=A0AAD7EF73_9AGAR|nr:hypothetical protein DFH08DRAFT_971281 [Mycena albidolilacea]